MQAALADITDQQHQANELLPRYRALVDHYRKLLKITRKIFLISDCQGRALQLQQNEIRNLLDNANQGFLTFSCDFKVDQHYSAECIRIFNKKIAGLSITRLLAEAGDIAKDLLEEVLERAFLGSQGDGQKVLAQFPQFFRINDRNIQVECKRIEPAGSESNLIMMILTDMTEKILAEEQIRYLSYHDRLTNLYNRAYVDMILPELEQGENLPFSIIMVDMNGLKLVNDVFGHEQGDHLLVAMAEVFLQSCRPHDVISRWGGDEFLILLPRTNHSECLQVCEQIRLSCEQVDCIVPLSAAIGTMTKDEGAIHLEELFSIAENRMYNDKLIKRREVRQKIITRMESMLHNNCYEDIGHSERMLQLASDFMAFLEIGSDTIEMKLLGQLVALHDIGKITIPRNILGKPGPLTLDEWEIIKSHSDVGYRIARSMGEPALADVILALHERWGGDGYPYGLKGDQLPLLARIFSLIDVYDVITHERPYGVVLNKQSALQEIAAAAGTQFDPQLTKKFLEFMQ